MVSRIVITRLAQPDARELFRRADDGSGNAAAARVAELRSRLDGFIDQAADGTLSPSALARVEARLMPQIEQAERQAAVIGLPAVLVDLVTADDVATSWAATPVFGQRQVVEALMRIRLRRAARRGPYPLDLDRLDIAWRQG